MKISELKILTQRSDFIWSKEEQQLQENLIFTRQTYDYTKIAKDISEVLKNNKEAEKKTRKHEEAERKTKKYKTEKDQILDTLLKNSIACFYHFTAEENLEYIKKHGGLYSWYALETKSIQVPFIGGSGDDSPSHFLDKRHGLEDYVRLSFCDDHPMQFRWKNKGVRLVLLKIDVKVAVWKDSLFSDINATDNNHRIGSSLKDLQNVDFLAVKRNYVSRNDPDFKPHQAEVLVKTFIPIEYIMNINNPLYL